MVTTVALCFIFPPCGKAQQYLDVESEVENEFTPYQPNAQAEFTPYQPDAEKEFPSS
jgi:hypothetical protein